MQGGRNSLAYKLHKENSMRQERKYRSSNDDASDLALADLEAPETSTTAKHIEDTLRRQNKEQRVAQRLQKIVDRCAC